MTLDFLLVCEHRPTYYTDFSQDLAPAGESAQPKEYRHAIRPLGFYSKVRIPQRGAQQ